MYIERGKENEIPEGAIRLSRDEVFNYISNLVKNWPNSTELWALKYGNPILSSAVVLSSTIILSFYRKQLKLKNYGQFTLFVPVVIVPSLINQIYHNKTTIRKVILQDDCSLCIFTNSGTIQLGIGVFYPLVSSMVGTYLFAHRLGTFYLTGNRPDVVSEFAKHVVKTSKPLFNKLTVFVIGHLLLSYAVTYYQMENLEFLRLSMLKQQEEEISYRNEQIKK